MDSAAAADRLAPTDNTGAPTGDPVPVEIEYFAWAADTVGTEAETLDVRGGNLAGVREAIIDAHGERAEEMLASCRFFVDSVLTRDLDMAHGRKVDVLPPFTGG